MDPISRRSVLQFGGLAGAITLAGRAAAQVASGSNASTLAYAEHANVTLLDGPMLEQFRAHHATLLAMVNEDALLKAMSPRGRFAGARRGPGRLV